MSLLIENNSSLKIIFIRYGKKIQVATINIFQISIKSPILLEEKSLFFV